MCGGKGVLYGKERMQKLTSMSFELVSEVNFGCLNLGSIPFAYELMLLVGSLFLLCRLFGQEPRDLLLYGGMKRLLVLRVGIDAVDLVFRRGPFFSGEYGRFLLMRILGWGQARGRLGHERRPLDHSRLVYLHPTPL